ncbi:hypothetical protein [Cupriavidus pauculus]|uniref:hypothetical protein n=1 Tax=Cupriavidus pauculus TaxID=82633 RepID=UPI0015626BF9|nr:hypothetical protein [Cupriavidus pauculus]
MSNSQGRLKRCSNDGAQTGTISRPRRYSTCILAGQRRFGRFTSNPDVYIVAAEVLIVSKLPHLDFSLDAPP